MIISNFVVLEGIDGAGTTTQSRLLKERMGNSLVLTAEPTTGEVGCFLRRILGGEVQVAPLALAYLFAADRAQHLYGKDGIVETAKDPSVVVLSDRYLFSSIVYQGDAARQINASFPLPALLLYLRIDGEEAYRRVNLRGGKKEIFEKKDALVALSAKYDALIAEYDRTSLGEGMRVATIDAAQSADDVAALVWREVSRVQYDVQSNCVK